MENLKKTPLCDDHIKLGAEMVEFAGWYMPIKYEGLVPEHQAVREQAGLFDVSHMGEVEITGKDAESYVQNLVSNNAKVLEDSQIMYTHMCYPEGGTVDDLLVYKFGQNHFYLVINASNIEKDFAWMLDQKGNFDVEIVNQSDITAEVALQGPNAQKILQKLTDTDLNSIKFFYCQRGVLVDGAECLVSRTGYTGEDGFEIYMDPKDASKVWNAILEAGKEEGVAPAGLGCRDTLRFEVALPLYGQELSKDISPLQAGLSMFVKLDNDDFIGKSALVKQKEEGLGKKVVGFEMLESAIPRHGYKVVAEGKEIGEVTTGYLSPSVNKKVGYALVDIEYAKMGTEIEIQVRKKTKKAVVCSKRFYKKNYAKK